MSHHFTDEQLDAIDTEFSKGIDPQVAAHRLGIPRPHSSLLRIMQDRMTEPLFALAMKKVRKAPLQDKRLGIGESNFCVERSFMCIRKAESELTEGFSDFSEDELDRLEGELESLLVKIATLRGA